MIYLYLSEKNFPKSVNRALGKGKLGQILVHVLSNELKPSRVSIKRALKKWR